MEAPKRPANLRLEQILEGHRNEWVALGEDWKVIASGETFKKATENAVAKGCEHPLVIWAPADLQSFRL